MTNDKLRTTRVKKATRATNRSRAARERQTIYKRAARPKLTQTEARALAEFRARLKEILPNGELKSLILYGSKARGDTHPGSDIDLLVVYDSAQGERKERIWDAAGEILFAAYESDPKSTLDIAPLVLTEPELRKDAALGMPLLLNVAREGIVLEGEHVVPGKMDRKYWTTAHLGDAKRQLDSARVLLEHGDIPSAISMAYFIYLDAARAALIAKGIAPQSHAGTNRLFGLHFINTGLLPKKFGPHFGRLETDRLEATYIKEKHFTREDVERALTVAEELITAVEKFLPTLMEEK